jgi:flagellar protein FliO/FliZ
LSLTENIESQLLIAADDQPGTANDSTSTFSTWNIIRMILVFITVIAAIYTIFYFIKKRTSAGLQGNNLIRILGSQPISSNRNLHLIKVGEQIFLIGSSENAVNLISEINDRESIDHLLLEISGEESHDRKSFSDVFSGFFKPTVATNGSSMDSVTGSLSFMRKQKERLKRM